MRRLLDEAPHLELILVDISVCVGDRLDEPLDISSEEAADALNILTKASPYERVSIRRLHLIRYNIHFVGFLSLENRRPVLSPELCDAVGRHASLTHLCLESVEMPAAGADSLTAGNIKSLFLTDCIVRATRFVADLLAADQLEELRLFDCNFKGGVELLCDALRAASSLRIVSIQCHHCRKKRHRNYFLAICAALGASRSRFQGVCLDMDGLTPSQQAQAGASLGAIVARCDEYFLCDVLLGDAGLPSLFAGLATNKRITSVSLYDYTMTDECAWHHLVPAVQAATALKQFDGLPGPGFDAGQYARLLTPGHAAAVSILNERRLQEDAQARLSQLQLRS